MVLPAQVPGGIYSDLRRNQVLRQDLLYGKNDLAYRWVGQENWTYTTAFAIDQHIAMSQSVKLVLHGVDTVATVYMNGEEVGQTDNMFVRYKFDVKAHLKLVGLKNVLVIKFESPIKYAARQSRQSIRQNRGKIIPPYCPSPAQRGECHVNFIRKMQASFSWDWGPAFPSVGIYKSIDLEFGSFGMIRDIIVDTRRLAPPVAVTRRRHQHPPQVIISSTIRNNVRAQVPANRSVPYMRAPPYFVPSGGHHDLDLSMEQPQRIDSWEPDERLMEENWLLKTQLVLEMVQPTFAYNIRVEFDLDGVLHYESEHISVVANSEGVIRLGFNLRIDNTRLRVKSWWPSNAGGQPLYKLTARIMPIPASGGDKSSLLQPDERQSALQARAKPLQTPAVPPLTLLTTGSDHLGLAPQVNEKSVRFGFRTVELIQEPVTRGNLNDGLTFNFRINGVDLFAMGSNWIPSSILPENSNDLEYVRYLLESARDANMNMLRVWGGGIYESDEFYQLADELGIMIWHDFMFACALYPTDERFLAGVRVEIEQQVQRLQHHPSIVLWAGNNENEMAIAGPWWAEVMIWNKKLREAYATLYYETIRPIVTVIDQTRPYVESSPSNGLLTAKQPDMISRHPNDNKYGDVHHYDYLTDSFDWTVYPNTRFASEYGFQSYPSFNALTSISPQADWKYPLTSNILHRQHRLTGETEIKLQLRVHFNEIKPGGVDKLKSFIYLTQLTQAIAIKTETEFYRRNRHIDPETKLGKTMGALYWQLNDVWQAPTWSSIEYGGKWKMLHYFARRFFFRIQVMPYLVQPAAAASPISNSIQQAVSNPIGALSSLASRLTADQQQTGHQIDPVVYQQQNPSQQQASSAAQFVIDLVRDDLIDSLDSFNVTIRFYRWTSFVPVWQDTVYIRNTQPQNVTRIYEQDVTRIARQPGVVSLSSGVFQVLIEQQPQHRLSQIENYLMPVAPNKVTAMRVARINVEHIEGPLELNERARPSQRRTSDGAYESLLAQPLWACAYRLTLVSDSIAMFVWLDLNLPNSDPLGANNQQPFAQQTAGPQQQQHVTHNGDQDQPTASGLRPSGGVAPAHIHLDSLPPHVLSQNNGLNPSRPGQQAADHIRIHLPPSARQQPLQGPSGNIKLETFETSPSDSLKSRVDGAERGPLVAAKPTGGAEGQALDGEQQDHEVTSERQQRSRRPLDQLPHEMAPERIVLNTNDNNLADSQLRASQVRSQHSHQLESDPQHGHRRHQQSAPFRPVDASGGNMLRYQFSDNAFNMFEPSKVVDLYLSRCLSRAQIVVALEVQSMADSL